MIRLSQRDPRWAGKTIGKSNSTIGRYGCTITDLSMASDWFGCYKDPGWMAKNLRFLGDLVIWSSIERVLCFKFIWRFHGYKEKLILEALGHKTKIVLLHVRNRHWVLCIRKSIYPWSRWFKTADPWTGTDKWYHSSEITGGSILDKK